MKFNARKLIALLLCLAMCLSLIPAAVAAEADAPIKIACIGDSITYGHNPADGGRTQIKNNWPTVLGELLGDGYDVRNFGQNGITLLKSGGTPVWSIAKFTQSKEFLPDIVIIMLGTNDSPPATGWNKGAEFTRDYKELIEVYRNLDSHPEVYVATSATAFGNGGFNLPPSSIHENIVPLQKQIAAEMNCPVIDIHEATKDMGDLFPDNIHPNEEGHKRMGQYIYTALTGLEVLEPNGHVWDEGVVTTKPTSTSTGIKTFTCTICGETRTKTLPRTGGKKLPSIDFTDPASLDQVEIVNQATAAIKDGGLYLVSTKDAMEDCNGQLSGDAAVTPKDLVKIPVSGDWTATMKFQFSQGSSRGYYEFFGFYAMEDDDLVGIRGGDGGMQDFTRLNGTMVKETMSSASGLKSASTHWYKMEKAGDSYTCSWSVDGEEFVPLFTYEDTGLEAEYLVLDAYSGMATGYNYTVEYVEFETPVTLPDDIDFTNPADAAKFEVINQKTAAIEEGVGLTLTCTRPAFEPCNGQNSGDQAIIPEDVISVPVSGDWEATLEFVFSTGSARNGYYQFFAFDAAQGDDFQNLAGIRGGDGAMQNFLRIDGVVTADTAELNSTPGLANNGATYWYRIAKGGDTYVCSRSSDGEEFTEMFRYEATGIEADSILIDAYTGMTEGYQFTLKSLIFAENTVDEPVVPEEPAELAIVTEPVDFTGSIGETAKFAVEVNRTDVTYQWMWSKDGGKTWEASEQTGFDTAEVAVVLKSFRNGQMYKVVVTDSTGATVDSAAVKMSTPTAGLKIVADPADAKVAVNQAAVFSVKAEGEGLTYQWMYSNNGGSYWSVSTADGATTASMSIAGKTFRNGQMYKCVVTDASGNVVESAPATMTVG